MRTILPIVAMLGAIACGVAGYEHGRRTAPRPWLGERKKMVAIKTGLAKRIRPMREELRNREEKYKDHRPSWVPNGSKKASAEPKPKADIRDRAKPVPKAKPTPQTTAPATRPR